MSADSYFHWLTSETPTRWWHDSADPDEIRFGIDHRACGATTNPVLVNTTLKARPDYWMPLLKANGKAESIAENRMQGVVTAAASAFLGEYERSRGQSGFVCAQVDPHQADHREAMAQMAVRFHGWAPNIAVKLPATAAGLDVLEDCVARGITVAATVSFTVPQVLAIAERHRKGSERARRAGLPPGRCYAVITIGRIDDYLTAVARDAGSDASPDDLRLAGLAIVKRAYACYRER
ncbi:MAG: transaldolase family protein, partial [Kiritimatiellae bacterium]|nr:transaldolase family protein [Kiritimatiellia bacterium]